MPYAYLTLTQARAQLAAKLYNSSFWADAELTAYIQESLRTWNSLTSFWRSEFILQTTANEIWYDITDPTTNPNTVRPFTVTDGDIVAIVQRHLLEPVSNAYPLAWTGSTQFSLTDVLKAIQRRRDEVLAVTGCTITQSDDTVAGVGRTFLPDTVVDVRRVAWLPAASPAGQEPTPLSPDDEWALNSFDVNFTLEMGIPSTFRMSTEPPLSFDVDVIPEIPGTYDILTVRNGVAISDQLAQLLGVPDDFSWVIKWGVLADLLGRESNAKDELRAKYCEMRYQQGIAALTNASAILNARIANVTMDVDSVQNADNFRSGWQAETPGEPDLLMIGGLNIVGVAPKPDGVYSLSLTVVQNAPIPVIDNDSIQVGRDDLEVILDYAQHLASFKMGGAEFMATGELLQRFYKKAATYTSKLDELGEFFAAMAELSQLQNQTNPVYSLSNPVTQ